MPCPVPTTTLRHARARPMIGSPSGVTGRGPTHTSRRPSRSAPASTRRAVRTMPSTRRPSISPSDPRAPWCRRCAARRPSGVQADVLVVEEQGVRRRPVDADVEAVALAGGQRSRIPNRRATATVPAPAASTNQSPCRAARRRADHRRGADGRRDVEPLDGRVGHDAHAPLRSAAASESTKRPGRWPDRRQQGSRDAARVRRFGRQLGQPLAGDHLVGAVAGGGTLGVGPFVVHDHDAARPVEAAPAFGQVAASASSAEAVELDHGGAAARPPGPRSTSARTGRTTGASRRTAAGRTYTGAIGRPDVASRLPQRAGAGQRAQLRRADLAGVATRRAATHASVVDHHDLGALLHQCEGGDAQADDARRPRPRRPGSQPEPPGKGSVGSSTNSARPVIHARPTISGSTAGMPATVVVPTTRARKRVSSTERCSNHSSAASRPVACSRARRADVPVPHGRAVEHAGVDDHRAAVAVGEHGVLAAAHVGPLGVDHVHGLVGAGHHVHAGGDAAPGRRPGRPAGRAPARPPAPRRRSCRPSTRRRWARRPGRSVATAARTTAPCAGPRWWPDRRPRRRGPPRAPTGLHPHHRPGFGHLDEPLVHERGGHADRGVTAAGQEPGRFGVEHEGVVGRIEGRQHEGGVHGGVAAGFADQGAAQVVVGGGEGGGHLGHGGAGGPVTPESTTRVGIPSVWVSTTHAVVMPHAGRSIRGRV